MESLLTKQLKLRMLDFNPFNSSAMRTIRWATEVTTKNGVVDLIRFEDWQTPTGSTICRNYGEYVNEFNETENNIMVTCYEIKISLSDFKSKNGHNFVGNRNYYVIPSYLYLKIKDLVPEKIGVIVVYTEGTQQSNIYAPARVKIESEIVDIQDSDKALLLYNALKKWVDGKCSYNKLMGGFDEQI